MQTFKKLPMTAPTANSQGTIEIPICYRWKSIRLIWILPKR